MSLTAEPISVEAEQHKDTMIHLAASSKNVRYEIIKSPKHGSYALDPTTGHFQYRSEKEFHGVDTMTYIVTKDGEESTPADVVIKVLRNDEKTEMVELVLEVPARPDVDDCLDAIDGLLTELTELIHGDDDDEDDDD